MPVAALGLLLSIWLLFVGTLEGCALIGSAVPDPEVRRRSAAALAEAGGFREMPTVVHASGGGATALPVAAWIKPGDATGCVRVYLEGDGLAWRTRRRPSRDPTPVDPVGLKLALADRSNATLVYLARPCQYGGADALPCRPTLWTTARYSEQVVAATNERLGDVLRSLDAPWDAQNESQDLTLIGFSGGGVVAALLAARRNDIDRLITIAAPLDTEYWTREQAVSPLELSLSPMDEIETLRCLEQDHFVGLEDEIVPVTATERFREALGPDAPARLHRVAGVGHRDWVGRADELFGRDSSICGGASN